MAPTNQLDSIFNHYIAAVMRRAKVEPQGTQWLASVQWVEHVEAADDDPTVARTQLEEAVSGKVFDIMRRGQALRIVDGIDLNGGSC